MLVFLRTLWFRVSSLINRRQLERDLVDELRLHRELLEAEARRHGAEPAVARRIVVAMSGGVDSSVVAGLAAATGAETVCGETKDLLPVAKAPVAAREAAAAAAAGPVSSRASL